MECSEIIIGNTYRVVNNESVLEKYRGKMVEVVARSSLGKLLDIIILDTGEKKTCAPENLEEVRIMDSDPATIDEIMAFLGV